MKKAHIFLLSIILMLAILVPAAQAATVQIRYYAGVNTWNWNAHVITSTFDGSGDDSISVFLPDIDAVFSSYDDQTTITVEIGWTFSTGNSTMTLLGDASEAYLLWVYDFPGF